MSWIEWGIKSLQNLAWTNKLTLIDKQFRLTAYIKYILYMNLYGIIEQDQSIHASIFPYWLHIGNGGRMYDNNDFDLNRG